MAKSTNYPLSVTIKAIDKVSSPIARINASVAKLTQTTGFGKLAAGFSGLGSSVHGVGKETLKLGATLGGLAAAAGFGLFSVVKGAADAGDKLNEMSQRVGLSVDAYAQLQFAAGQADIEQGAFNSSLDQFNKSIGQAKAGTGRFLAFMQKVSPSLANQVKHTKSNQDALFLMAKAFEKVEDPAKRAALATAAFGDAQFGQFLGQGSEEIQKQMRRYFEFAGSQEKSAQRADAFNNALNETALAFAGVRNAAVGALFPALTQLATALTNIVSSNRTNIAAWAERVSKAITGWIQTGGLERLTENLKNIAAAVVTVVDRLGGLQNVAMMVGAYMSIGLVGSLATAAKQFLIVGSSIASVIPWAASWLNYLWMMRASLGPALLIPLKAAAAASWAFMAPWLPLAAAILGVGAALYQVNKHWDELKQAGFSDVGAWMKDMVGIKETDEQAMQRMNKGGTGAAAARPMLDAASAAPPIQSSRQTNDARVSVDFSNLPKGARVTPSPDSTAQLDLSMGYSMVTL